MSDERQIHALLERVGSAWNAGDAAAYADLFTDDADYITFFGWHFEGRQAIEQSHRGLFEGPLKGSRIGFGSGDQDAGAKIRFLTPDTAVVVSAGGTTMPGQREPDPERDSIMTLTAVREADGAWRFASFQNTRRTTPPGVRP